ncbi:MAG: hypothetical protein KAI24_24285 [Planctomycetes bacterium]|nr:hypothetical protein [Planctomycetota bacterium]
MSGRRRFSPMRALRRVPWRRIPLRPHTRRGAGALAVVLLALLWLTSDDEVQASGETWSRRQILDAIRWVESRGVADPDVPDGDDGLAIGPYQIHRVYWIDAYSYDEDLGGRYQDCRRRDYSERVIDAYMRRYAAEAWRTGDAERIARVHNGGPTGHRKQATDRYWQKVRSRLPEP